MKKYLPQILGILLIIAGLGTVINSIPGSLLMILAGLILFPTSRLYLISKSNYAAKLNNQYVCYGLVLLLLAISSAATNWSEKNSIINKFKNEKVEISKKITDYQDKKEFIKAGLIIDSYLKVMPSNTELLGWKNENEDKKSAEQKIKAEKELAERQAEKDKASTPSDGSQPGYKYVLVNKSTARQEAVYSSYGACSSAKVAKGSKDWDCIGRPKFTNE